MGAIVWVRDPSRELSPWWPAEVYDPWALPPGIVISAEQVCSACTAHRTAGGKGDDPWCFHHSVRHRRSYLEDTCMLPPMHPHAWRLPCISTHVAPLHGDVALGLRLLPSTLPPPTPLPSHTCS